MRRTGSGRGVPGRSGAAVAGLPRPPVCCLGTGPAADASRAAACRVRAPLCVCVPCRAPEIVQHRRYSLAVDMWSLGVILFILLT